MAAGTRHRGPLSRGQIVAAALESIDTEGVDQLTMRRLGQRLEVDPMAVYHHVPNKAALLDGIVEHLWSRVNLPDPVAEERWQDVIHAVFTTFRQQLLQHPRAVVLVSTRPSVTPTMLRLIDDTLGRLEAGGLPGRDAMQLIDCLSGYTVGKVLAEIGEPLGGVSDVVQTGLADVTPDTHPNLVQAQLDGYEFTPDQEFDRGLQAMVQGWS